MRAEIRKQSIYEDAETVVGTVVDGAVHGARGKTKARVESDGRVFQGDDWTALVDLKTGHVMRGPAHDRFSVGRTDPDGTVYDENSEKLGSVVLQDAEDLSGDEQLRRLFLVGGVARMSLLHDDFDLDPMNWS